MPNPWRRRSSAVLVKDQYLTLRADACELPSGKLLDPYYVVEDNDWVHVFALGPQGHVLTVSQYRYAAQTVTTELPGGIVDEGEAPLATAQRELQEETGFRAARWTSLGWAYANPARQTNRVHIFLAEDLDAGGAQSLDASEDIEHAFLPPDQIKAQIREGKFSQLHHIATFYLCLEHLAARSG
ncbi:MAG TPA: NUDIX hydrolase [Polyangiales bacterium]|nr:NUDIX hydrolase [Polyangiales bacterium]